MIKRLMLLGMTASALGGPSISGQQTRAFEACAYVPESSAVLVLTDEISGHIYIRDWEDTLVVELNKPCGNRVEVGLDEGDYTVVNIWERDAYESAIALRPRRNRGPRYFGKHQEASLKNAISFVTQVILYRIYDRKGFIP